ncbi:MAG: MFS transporter [Anaerolineae bacterium]|nr:MFS transporter [Anaerolineae bacterium]
MLSQLPPSIKNAYWFQCFNTLSWQMCLASPLILFARELGASSLVLGVLAGLTPLASIVQLWFAPRAAQIGYRKLTVGGWRARTLALGLLAALPLLPEYLGARTVEVLVILTMITFTVLRGAGITAWLPWVSALVPREIRGAYLSRDRIFVNVGALVAMAISGLLLIEGHRLSSYSLVFGIGFVCAVVSLWFLNRMPDISSTSTTTLMSTSTNTSWLAPLKNRNFMRLVRFGMLVQLPVAAHATFALIFAREQVGVREGIALWLNAGAYLLAMVASVWLRSRMDRLGSKRFLWLVLGWWLLSYLVWWALSLGGLQPALFIAPLLMVSNGFFTSIYDLSATRLLMNSVTDEAQSPRYFALYSVIVNVTVGLVPMMWGALLDAWRDVRLPEWLGEAANRYTLFFGLEWLLLGLVALALWRLREEKLAR